MERSNSDVVWRATDCGFLTRMIPDLRRPGFENDILPKFQDKEVEDGQTTYVAATKALREVYNELVLHWKGVVWTAKAERRTGGRREWKRPPSVGKYQVCYILLHGGCG